MPAPTSPTIDYTLHPNETVGQYNTRIAAASPDLPAPGTTSSTGVTNTASVQQPAITQIPNPVAPPTTTSTPAPTLPPQQGGNTANQFMSSVSATLDGQKTQLDSAYKSQIADKQSQIDSLSQSQQEIQQLQDNNMLSEGSTIAQETTDKQNALATEQQQVKENYDANQSLINEMDGLLQQGNDALDSVRDTVGGTVGFMNAQVSKTMTAVAARVGVIQAVLAARNNQIGVAQSQLKSSLDTITSIYGDQINYYKALNDFYQQQKSDNGSQIAALSKDEQAYIDAQLKQLQDNVTQTQTTANAISKAMLDPSTALAYAKAGVTLNDSIPEINQKIATQAYAQELSDSANKMAAAGYSSTPIAGVTPVTTTDSQGNSKNWYKRDTSGGFTIGGTRFDANGNVIASIPGGSSLLTKSQIQNGAANAGVSINDFTALSPDVQSYYNQLSSTSAAAISKAISDANSGAQSPGTVKSQIDSSNAAPAVKTYLKSLINPTASSNGGALSSVEDFFKGAWSKLTGQ